MPHDAALMVLGTIQQQLASLARNIVKALADSRITPLEGLLLAQQGTMVASSLVLLLQGLDTATRQDLLVCLERGHWTMEDTPG
jgi:hypothetical protein